MDPTVESVRYTFSTIDGGVRRTQTRVLGDTGHESTTAVFGAIVPNRLEQEGVDQMVERVLSRGVNHLDVALTYGDAELKLGPKLRQYREDVFLGCRAQERSYEGAKRKLDRSFDRLGIDYIDLYQVHSLGYESGLGEITVDDGTFVAFCKTRDEGKIGRIGLTSHGNPGLIRDAIDYIGDLEILMFPLNPVVVGKGDDGHDYEGVSEAAEEAGIGTFGIKAFARGPWPNTNELPEVDRPSLNRHGSVDTSNEIAGRFDFAVAQGLTSVVTPGDPKFVAMVLDAAMQYNGADETAQRPLVERLRHDESLVSGQLHH